MISSSTPGMVLPVPPCQTGTSAASSQQTNSSPTTLNLHNHHSSLQVIGIGGSPDSTTTTGAPGKDKDSIRTTTNNSTTNNTSMYSLKWNTQLLALQRSLANLWDSGIGTDAVLLCQGTPLPVHKIILTAASPYVASVVQTMATASHMMPVIVVDIPAEAGKALLSFLYCGEAHVPVSIIPQLVQGAKFLGISGFGEPGVLESLTSMVPDRDTGSNPRAPTPASRTSPPSPSPIKSESSEETGRGSSIHSGYFSHPGLHISPAAPSPTPSVQSHYSRKSDRSSSPYQPPQHFLESLKLTRVSPKSGSRAHGGLFGGTSILDNLLKNPRGQQQQLQRSEQEYSHGHESPMNLSCNSGMADDDDNCSNQGGGGGGYYDDHDNDHDGPDGDGPIPAQLLEPNVEYHIGNDFGVGRGVGLPLSIQNPLIDLAKVASAMQEQQQHHHHNSTRGVKRKSNKISAADLISSTGVRHSILDPSVPTPVAPPAPKTNKPKKPQEAIICEICNKKFSNAYNLRVHMEGHSGQVFVCSVCSHASRSRDALRKHFAYRHRELWISGMSAFRKGSGAGVTGRKLSISKPNNNNNNVEKMEVGLGSGESNNNNNNSLIDANGKINLRGGGSDGTLTISEAYPEADGK